LHLELLRNADEISAPRAKLRREHADAFAVADFIDFIEDIHDVEADRRGPREEVVELVRDSEIDLRIGRHARAVWNVVRIRAQSASVNHVDAESRAVPKIR